MKHVVSILVLATLLTRGPDAWGQCIVGVYGDADATVNIASSGAPWQGNGGLDLYVVLQVEDIVSAVAFEFETDLNLFDPVLNPAGDYLLTDPVFGPTGNGLNVLSPGGNNVGLGECAVGFGGQKIVVARYTLISVDLVNQDNYIAVRANVDAHPEQPAYATCQNEVLPCEAQPFFILMGVRTESQSWSRVKALF